MVIGRDREKRTKRKKNKEQEKEKEGECWAREKIRRRKKEFLGLGPNLFIYF